MRGLTTQFLAPIAMLLLGLGAGWYFYATGWGIVGGGAAAVATAVVLARRAAGRLRTIQSFAAGTLSGDNRDSYNTFDDIGETLRIVTEATIAQRRQYAIVEHQLVQQALVLDRMNDGLMRVTADFTIHYANVAAGTLFGGRNPTGRSFMGVTRDHELNAALRRCLETGADQQHTFEIAGESRLLSAVIIQLSARPPEALVMLRDITEVSRLQNLRRDFVANVSHELRTPLSTIKILTETLIDLREDDDEAVSYLTKIDGEVDSMTALVRDLLDLTRLETQGGQLTTRAIDAEQLVLDVCERMRPLAERQQVAIAIDGEALPAQFMGDERRLHQALINLVTNAINHTSVGGSVVIGVRVERDIVEFIVRDTGSGIAARDLPRIWERFFKTDKARSGPGTGLGLAIVKHIAQAHHGSVAADSELGKGSTFTISIPRVTPPPRPIGGRTETPTDFYVPG